MTELILFMLFVFILYVATIQAVPKDQTLTLLPCHSRIDDEGNDRPAELFRVIIREEGTLFRPSPDPVARDKSERIPALKASFSSSRIMDIGIARRQAMRISGQASSALGFGEDRCTLFARYVFEEPTCPVLLRSTTAIGDIALPSNFSEYSRLRQQCIERT
ncbi:hypothetical protein HK107_12640 [Parvularcula sp. ZS-1/3]|uniref:Uncharacterized protein n=1 Tax=Parvularcula mediterranea TaxID=2732508 RepID=A0A7Y3RP89_9PROT|nr:hypothetical protein [Parvularcula mediterranea]NNU17171.1 hypothetical protein [Parvularcula mediterranea]